MLVSRVTGNGSPKIAVQCGLRGRQMELLKISSKTRPAALAGALAGVIREHGKAEMQAVGAGAVNQAVKAIAIAGLSCTKRCRSGLYSSLC